MRKMTSAERFNTLFMSSAANPEWDTALGVVVPVGARVTGSIYDPDGTRRLFDHWYEMFHYRQTVDNPQVFEVKL